MFDESFFVALAFATVIAAFLFLKLPQRLLAALDAKSAEIADELQQARKLREEAEAREEPGPPEVHKDTARTY